MPELPEIETFRRIFLYGRAHQQDASPPLLGKRIVSAHLLWERTLAAPGPEEFKTRIAGQTIQDIDRRGKYLLLRLSEGVLVIHLRMSGDLIIEPGTEPIAKHHRLLLNFEDGSRLAFNDTRKFGRVWLTGDSEVLLSHLGPEPLDESFTPEILYEKLQNRKRQIKPLLLDQSFTESIPKLHQTRSLAKRSRNYGKESAGFWRKASVTTGPVLIGFTGEETFKIISRFIKGPVIPVTAVGHRLKGSSLVSAVRISARPAK